VKRVLWALAMVLILCGGAAVLIMIALGVLLARVLGD
jgi:hypothetical protein